MPVVILCGGLGTRLREETELRPKPMVEIGGKPILWHIINLYSHYGFNQFILCLGYKSEVIKDYFLNYDFMNNDFTLTIGSKPVLLSPQKLMKNPWKITLVDTGESAMTGARVKLIEPHIKSDTFMLTYGDGVANINIAQLMKFHQRHGKIGTVTGVRPQSRFGELVMEKNTAIEFSEKPQIRQGYINGGFFVFQKKFFKYLSAKEDLILEQAPLRNLARDRELMVYQHQGFWHCMDTYRDYQLLNNLWKTGNAPWKALVNEK
ncbi:MAG TPA: glucose-1-phosphate cytidylyltransferase [Elusimicrobiota bacterium]|nr:glucose-1-phosphate cytidylyltransferase [Elusimicrobiota bacterium]